MLVVENLSVGPVCEASFSLALGEIVVISGPSGSGKTCVLRAIADMMAHQGRICLKGVEQQTIAPSFWRSRVQMVPAASQWWFPSVRAHFADPIDTSQWTALNLDPTLLDTLCLRLSSGQKQRLALLRAMQQKPEILLLDEPTANLDSENRNCLVEFLQSQARNTGTGILWVSHDPEVIHRLSSRVFQVGKGGLVSGNRAMGEVSE